jgi:6-phosphogluconate dehydrogenase (decarboxylating)
VGIGFSIFLFVIGAILTFAVDVGRTSGFDLNTVGIILMVGGPARAVRLGAVVEQFLALEPPPDSRRGLGRGGTPHRT